MRARRDGAPTERRREGTMAKKGFSSSASRRLKKGQTAQKIRTATTGRFVKPHGRTPPGK